MTEAYGSGGCRINYRWRHMNRCCLEGMSHDFVRRPNQSVGRESVAWHVDHEVRQLIC